MAAFRVHGCIRSWNEAEIAWIDLESYENMHNLIAAIWQSLPTAVLNSGLFSLGNKPSHGILLSGGLFATALIASCFAMLKSLVVVLWEAHKSRVNPLVYTARLANGSLLAGEQTQPAARVDLVTNQYLVSGSAPLGSPVQKSPPPAPVPQHMRQADPTNAHVVKMDAV